MNWLQSSKSWLTLIDATTYLAENTGVSVPEADLLLFAVEGRVSISARFTEPVAAVAGTIIEPLSDDWIDFIEEDAHPLPGGIEGIFDLRIIGNPRTVRVNAKGEIESRTFGLEFHTIVPRRVIRIDTATLPSSAHWVIKTDALLAFALEHATCNENNFPDIAVASPKAEGAVDPTSRENVEPYIQKYLRQETAILNALRDLGYDPAALPKNIKGRSGVKSLTRKKLAGRTDLFTEKAFDKTWERLRSDKRIADKPSAITPPK